MGSNMSCLGIRLSAQEYEGLFRRVEGKGQRYPLPDGNYEVWTSGDGLELWFQSGGAKYLGFNPHFRGKGRIPHFLAETSQDWPDWGPYDGIIGGRELKTPGADSGSPIVCASPDFALVRNFLPRPAGPLQVAAFAREARAFGSASEFHDTVPWESPEKVLGERSFFAVGLFEPGTADPFAPEKGRWAAKPKPVAMMSGVVLESRTLANPLTGEAYHWALLDAGIGTFDAVLDTKDFPSLPRPGNILWGYFWLSGRVG